jgi:hypothetical protein
MEIINPCDGRSSGNRIEEYGFFKKHRYSCTIGLQQVPHGSGNE